MKHILDSSFHYTPSHETDVRKTFERLRRELQRPVANRIARVTALAARDTGASRREHKVMSEVLAKSQLYLTVKESS